MVMSVYQRLTKDTFNAQLPAFYETRIAVRQLCLRLSICELRPRGRSGSFFFLLINKWLTTMGDRKSSRVGIYGC